MFPSNLLPSTYSRDPANNSPKQAFILKALSGPNPFSPLQSNCCVHYMIIARAVFQPTLAMATQTRFRPCGFQGNAAHLALFEGMCRAAEHQARSPRQPACVKSPVRCGEKPAQPPKSHFFFVLYPHVIINVGCTPVGRRPKEEETPRKSPVNGTNLFYSSLRRYLCHPFTMIF